MHPEIATDESASLCVLLTTVNADHFRNRIRHLHTRFNVYATTCPVPLPAPWLVVTPEIRAQCERYLPIAEISAAFYYLYRAALASPPILSSTPFYNSLSWADTFALLPTEFQFSPNPALLLEAVLSNDHLLIRFLFSSFLPERFYGGIGRYPGQAEFIKEWLTFRKRSPLNCLDAACGTGEETFGLGLILAEHGFSSGEITIQGWTVEPLEVWAANHRRFPHNHRREELLRKATAALFSEGFGSSISFSCQNILTVSAPERRARNGAFDLILCNGLLGGPIIHEKSTLELAVSRLTHHLAPGGMLLAADAFHGGWKQKCPQSELRALFTKYGLKTCDAGEGIGGLKPY